MLLPGHPGEINSYKQHFWTGVDSCDLGQKADPLHKDHSGCTEVLKIKIMTWIQDLPHPRLSVLYIFVKYILYTIDLPLKSLNYISRAVF